MEAVVAVENVDGSAQTHDPMMGRPRPTDFLAYSRQYAAQMGLVPDITTWAPEDFQSFLDWWLLRTMRHTGDSEAG